MGETLKWLGVLATTVPLFALGGSAVVYVAGQFLSARERRRNHFFELMQFIDGDRPIAAKVAAVYQLRQFPRHKDFVIRFCTNMQNNITGPGSHLLAKEMELTRAYMETLATWPYA